jgi:hypothetical protein
MSKTGLQASVRIFTALSLFVVGSCGIDQGGVRVQSEPVDGTVVVSGPITGFGSVIANGLELGTSGTEVRIDGVPAAESDLRIGELIRAIAIRENASLRAASIELEKNVVGPVDAIDAVNGTCSVLGQLVRVDDYTRYDLSGAGGLAAVHLADRIVVSGFALSAGEILATYIGPADPNAALQLTGAVSNPDPAMLRFDLGTLTVDYSQSGIFDIPTGMLEAGTLIEVRGTTVTDGVLFADEIRAVAFAPGVLNAKSTALTTTEASYVGTSTATLDANFIGIVSDIDLPRRVSLGGVDVVLDGDTQILGGNATDITVGSRIQVEGRIPVAGEIHATGIRLF